MRWPFHFRKAVDDARADGAAAQSPPRHRDWASLPPLQRVIGKPELTAPTDEFVESLAGAQEPELSLETLGHHVSLGAPHGLIVGIARTVESHAPSNELIGRHRHRSSSRALRPADAIWPESEPEVESSVEAPEEPEPREEPEPPPPLRKLAAVDAPATELPSLTRLRERARATMSAVAPVQRSAPLTPDPAPPPAALPAVADEASPVRRLTLGQTRRLGLGAPLPPAAIAAIQQSGSAETATDLPLAHHTQRSEPELIAEPTSVLGGEQAEAKSETRTERSTRQQAPPLVQRSLVAPHRPNEAHSAPSAARPQSGSMEVQDAQAVASPMVQRVVARSVPSLLPARDPHAASVRLVPDRAPMLATRSPRAAAFEPDFAPPSEARPSLIDASGPRADDQVMTATAVAGVREMPPVPTLLPLPLALTAQRAAAWGMPEPPPPDAFEFATEPVFPGRTARGPEIGLQRQPAEEVPAAAPTPGEVAGGGTAATAVGATAAPGLAGGAPGLAGAPPAASEKDLDDLARKLHDRITAQIRYDLLVERERAGLVTDLR